jgi:hypothetical protein
MKGGLDESTDFERKLPLPTQHSGRGSGIARHGLGTHGDGSKRVNPNNGTKLSEMWPFSLFSLSTFSFLLKGEGESFA